jgi:thioredoxin reductase
MSLSLSYDVLIVGGSVAGLSAALALARATKRVLIVDNSSPCNRYSHEAHSLPGFDGRSPSEICDSMWKDVMAYPTVKLVRDTVTSVKRRAVADGMSLPENGPQMPLFDYETATGDRGLVAGVILAIGVQDAMPIDVAGLNDPSVLNRFWGSLVLHCPFCHGYEVKGKTWGVIYADDHSILAAKMYRSWTSNVVLFLNGKEIAAQVRDELVHSFGIEIIDGAITNVVFDADASEPQVTVCTNGSEEYTIMRVLFVRPKSVVPLEFASELGLEMTPLGLVALKTPMNETSVKGVFAAGDCTTPLRSLAIALADGFRSGAAMTIHLSLQPMLVTK